MRILILSMTAGAGHNTAARALEAAFKDPACAAGEAGEIGATFVDATELGSGLVRGLYNDAYLAMVKKTPTLWGYFYEHYDKPLSRSKEHLKTAFSRLNSRPLAKLLVREQPDLCLCTHFYPAEVALRLRAKGRLSSEIRVVLTDFAPHAFWVQPGADGYYVADDETAFSLARRGVPADRITVTGIPVHPRFGLPIDRQATATQLGISPDRFTVLVASGGMGVGPMEEVVSAIVGSGAAGQVLVVCGKNDALRQKLQAIRPPASTALHIYGFVDFMEKLMGASDVLVSKCGGLTSSEALAMGLPMIVIRPIPGQEEHNTDFLLERGAALKASDAAGLLFKLRLLAESPERRAALAAAARRVGRPRAARAIADHVLARVGLRSS